MVIFHSYVTVYNKRVIRKVVPQLVKNLQLTVHGINAAKMGVEYRWDTTYLWAASGGVTYVLNR